jgi:hypothetical protein
MFKKKILASVVSVMFAGFAYAGGGATGGATEVTQWFNHSELVQTVKQEMDNYTQLVGQLNTLRSTYSTTVNMYNDARGLIDTAKSQAQNKDLGSLANTLSNAGDKIVKMGELTDAVIARDGAAIDKIKSIASSDQFTSTMTPEEWNEKAKEISDRKQNIYANAAAAVGLSVAEAENRAKRREAIKTLVNSTEAGPERATRILQQLAQDQADISEQQLALHQSELNMEAQAKWAEEEQVKVDKKKQLLWLGVPESQIKQ